MIKKNIIYRFLLCTTIGVSTLVYTSSCEKFLDVESNHIVNEENKWKDINDIRGSLVGVYGLLRTALAENNAHWMYGELREGDFTALNRRDLQDIIEGRLNSSAPLVEQVSDWRRFYAVINAANLFIERSHEVLQHDKQYTPALNEVDIAQMHVVKGFVYYLLARTWGEVPIWDKAHEGVFPQKAVSTVEEVLTYAEREINTYKDKLPFFYGSIVDPVLPSELYLGFSSGKWAGVLFNRLSAYTMLAHINALSGNYLEASVYADYVIANASRVDVAPTDLSDITNTTNVGFFFGNRARHIIGFPFLNVSSEGSFEGHIESLTLAKPLVSKPNPDIYVTVDRIVDLFNEPDDQRFHIDSDGDIQTSYFADFGGIRPIFRKIHMIRNGESGTDGSLPLFTSALVFSRYEEISLLRAEAYAVLGRTEAATAMLNQSRKNRGLADISAGTDLIDAIFQERRKELMGEGWRWFDVVRYNKIKRNNPAFQKLIEEKGIYWPIAENALTNNRELEQNTYWK